MIEKSSSHYHIHIDKFNYLHYFIGIYSAVGVVQLYFSRMAAND
jgi:hypothetical protein